MYEMCDTMVYDGILHVFFMLNYAFVCVCMRERGRGDGGRLFRLSHCKRTRQLTTMHGFFKSMETPINHPFWGGGVVWVYCVQIYGFEYICALALTMCYLLFTAYCMCFNRHARCCCIAYAFVILSPASVRLAQCVVELPLTVLIYSSTVVCTPASVWIHIGEGHCIVAPGMEQTHMICQ